MVVYRESIPKDPMELFTKEVYYDGKEHWKRDFDYYKRSTCDDVLWQRPKDRVTIENPDELFKLIKDYKKQVYQFDKYLHDNDGKQPAEVRFQMDDHIYPNDPRINEAANSVTLGWHYYHPDYDD